MLKKKENRNTKKDKREKRRDLNALSFAKKELKRRFKRAECNHCTNILFCEYVLILNKICINIVYI